jgi:putative FmdB family regulatory protein
LPTYEYRCAKGHQYEKREGFDAPARQRCDRCGAQADRVLFAPPVVFKGQGFYKTDSRTGTDSSPGSPSSSTAEAGGDDAPSEPAAEAAAT